jgi:ATP-binding cassette subfamily C protein CydC
MKARRQKIFGMAMASLAQISAVGLLATAGWFIAASAVAGLSIFSTFIYLYPSALVRLFAVSRIGLNYWQRLLTHKASMNDFTTARLQFFDRASEKAELGAAVSGQLVERLLNDTEQVSLRLIKVWVPFVANLMTTVIAAVVVYLINPWLSVFFLVLAVFNFGAFYVMRAQLVTYFANRTRSAGEMRNQLIFAQASWQDLVSLGAARRVQADINGALSLYRQQILRIDQLTANWTVVISAVDVAIVALIMLVGFDAGAIDVRNDILLVLLAVGVFNNLLTLPGNATESAKIQLAQNRLALTDIEPGGLTVPFEHDFDGQRLGIAGYETPATVHGPSRMIAGDFQLGDLIVIKGPSGAGKSTFLTQLTKQLTPASVTYVTTDDYIFSGTVRDNLLIDPAAGAADAVLDELLEKLDLHLTLDEVVGEGGRELSGGESTRLGVARGLLTRTPILLLDEPFAGLDANSKLSTIVTIDELTKERLVFLVDHDTDTQFKRANKILELADLGDGGVAG